MRDELAKLANIFSLGALCQEGRVAPEAGSCGDRK